MRSTFNPARRNRNIGTAKQGHGQNNQMVIPKLSGVGGGCAARIGPHAIEERHIGGRIVTFIVEGTLEGYYHACTVDDIAIMLAGVPASDWAGLDIFVLRQPTRKGQLLNPVWGRLYYYADLSFSDRKRHMSGPMVFLEAVRADSNIKWSTGLDADDRQELEGLRSDGHCVVREGRKYLISSDIHAVRNTQLYRTLLHEIGHWFDWLEKVETPAARGGDYDELVDLYFARPKDEREAFAHRYADHLRAIFEAAGIIPFEKRAD